MKNNNEGIEKIEKKPKIEIYCKNPLCFNTYLARHKIKEVKSDLDKWLEECRNQGILIGGFREDTLREIVKREIKQGSQSKEKEMLDKFEKMIDERMFLIQNNTPTLLQVHRDIICKELQELKSSITESEEIKCV